MRRPRLDRALRAASGLGVALSAIASLTLASAPPGPATAEQAAAGRSLYRRHCAQCHGFNMISPGVSAPDLRRFPTDDKARFIATVSDGRNAMPSWKDKLSPADVEALWAYVSAGSTGSVPPPTR